MNYFHHRPSSFCRRIASERGIALVLTLAILVIVTMLVVAFAVSMRVENMASKNFNQMIQARQFAQGAVDIAVGQIRSAVTNATYATSPGAIFYKPIGGVWTNTLLYTPYVNSTIGSNDLNAGNWITGTNSFYTNGLSMFVGWSNVVAVSGVVTQYGRYAYWVDDESTKVNLNVASSRGSDLSGQTPAAIDLSGMFNAADQSAITTYAATIRPFDTLDCIQLANVTQPGEYSNQFYTTVNSSSPDYTPWGTKRTNVVWIATNSLSLDQKVAAISNALADANLGNWFGGQTFATKYPSVAQIAANIINYIGTAGNYPVDSTTYPSPPGSWADRTPPSYLGLEQTPYLNQLVISNTFCFTTNGMAPGWAKMTVTNTAFAQLWYPYTNSWTWSLRPEIYLTNTSIGINSRTSPPSLWTDRTPLANEATIDSYGGGAILKKLDYPLSNYIGTANPYVFGAVQLANPHVIAPVTNTAVVVIITDPGNMMAIFDANNVGYGYRIDYAQIPLISTQLVLDLGTLLPKHAGSFSTNLLLAASCNDPRVKPVSNSWTPTPNGTLNLAGPSPTVNYQTVSGVIRGDGDNSYHISAPPRRGTMYPGELAFIHTGVPWRSLWLQPEPPAEVLAAKIPDWAILDLFSQTDTTNVVGRINVNAYISNGVSLFPPRTVPLAALLTNVVAANTDYKIGMVTNNLYYGTPVSNSVLYTLAPSSGSGPLCPAAMTFIGEVCEIQGLATNNYTSTTLTNKFAAEAPVRGIANLITTRSNDFTIWAIAQSLQVTPTGTNVTGEVKVQTIVERYEDMNFPVNNPNRVKFRTRYSRYVTQ